MIPSQPEHSNGIEKGTQAVIEVLRDAYDDRNPEGVARDCIDAWLLASNPVGEPETIYDEFYRVRACARVALDAYDRQESSILTGAMEGIRGVLISVGTIMGRPS